MPVYLGKERHESCLCLRVLTHGAARRPKQGPALKFRVALDACRNLCRVAVSRVFSFSTILLFGVFAGIIMHIIRYKTLEDEKRFEWIHDQKGIQLEDGQTTESPARGIS